MSDLIDEAPEGQNAPEFSVSEISAAVKRMIEGEFGHVRIRGEVGRVSRPASGHVYLDLKDDQGHVIPNTGIFSQVRPGPEHALVVPEGMVGSRKHIQVGGDPGPQHFRPSMAVAAEGVLEGSETEPGIVRLQIGDGPVHDRGVTGSRSQRPRQVVRIGHTAFRIWR